MIAKNPKIFVISNEHALDYSENTLNHLFQSSVQKLFANKGLIEPTQTPQRNMFENQKVLGEFALKVQSMDASNKSSGSEFSTDLLRLYYERLFPYEQMFSWFSYGRDPKDKSLSSEEQDYFYRREWSFTIEDDIYIRYQCFRDVDEFKAGIQKRQPHKIDIGAVFTAPPKDHNTIDPEKFTPEERELVFDVDMDDYNEVRSCCTGAKICPKCWPFMVMAVKCVDAALREDFGYHNILWIFSGRRGVHCWVCDPAARALANEERDAVVSYLNVEFAGNENSADQRLMKTFTGTKESQGKMHPSLRRAYDILEPMFEKYIIGESGQGLLATKKAYMPILNALPDQGIREDLYKKWEKQPELKASDRWQMIKDATTPADEREPGKKRMKLDPDVELKLQGWRNELVLRYTYPRLDVNVSKHRNHLLKSPFCVHPKTGRVCVCIDPKKAETFNPFTVPTVRKLEEEINEFDKDPENANRTGVKDLDKTSLKTSIDFFENNFLEGLRVHARREARDRADKKSAMIVDF